MRINDKRQNNRQEVEKKRKFKSKNWRFNKDLSHSDLQNVNEVIRVYKVNQSKGGRPWKVVPKDSCEVYKQREGRKHQSQETKSRESRVSTENHRAKENSKRSRSKKSSRNSKKSVKNSKKKINQRRRRSPPVYITSTSATSVTSLSEMDCDCPSCSY